MYERATSIPAPSGILLEADHNWKHTQQTQSTRWRFFGHSYMALAPHVADMSATCRRHVHMSPNLGRHWTLRVVATQKRPQHTQFISIITDNYKSAQTYRYLSYHRVFVFELKQQSRNYRHVGNPPTCHQMSCRFGHPADTTFSCVCDMTETCWRHVADTTQNVAVWATKSTCRHPTCG